MSLKTNSKRLLKEDINKTCKELATYLLGKVLVRKLQDGTIIKGRIVETEAYIGGEDKGSYSYNNRRTPTNEPMYMPVGTTFVYMTYGMYYCINISSQESGAAVLLRALEPLRGIETMEKFRAQKNKSGKKVDKISQLCNGPSKLCIAMNITKENLNKVDLTDLKNELMWLEDDADDFDTENMKIVNCARIGIARAETWASAPLRYYILNNAHVSKRDKEAEKELETFVND